MFGIEALDVVIGMIFIYLLFSLFVSIINEVIGHLFNSRGSKLYDSILELIGKEAIQELFKDHRIKVLSKKSKTILNSASEFSKSKEAWPEYIPESLFGEIIAEIDNSKIGGIIGTLKDEIKNSSIKTKEAYEMALLKTKQTYKHHVRNLTFIVSVIVVLIFNVDSILIFNHLSDNSEARSVIIEQTNNFISSYVNEEEMLIVDSESNRTTYANQSSVKREILKIREEYLNDYSNSVQICILNNRFQVLETQLDSLARDSIMISYKQAVSDSLNNLVENLIKENYPQLADLDSAYIRLQHLYESEFNKINAALGFGWNIDSDIGVIRSIWSQIHYTSIIGWVISVFALSLGAPFWFDTLKRVINIKHEIKGKEKSEDGAVG